MGQGVALQLKNKVSPFAPRWTSAVTQPQVAKEMA
jgi:hypothetical protein